MYISLSYKKISSFLDDVKQWTFIILYTYEGWNFNFGNIPLDWIQELLE